MRRSWLAIAFGVLLVSRSPAGAQTVPWEVVSPGTTFATATDADAPRINPGAIALLRSWSARATYVGDARTGTASRGNSATHVLNATALSYAAPLYFGLAGSLGVSWVRPALVRNVTPGDPRTTSASHVVTADFGLAWAPLRSVGIGTRLRISGASATEPLQVRAEDLVEFDRLNGGVALDVGFNWRPWPALSLAIVLQNALGPMAPTLGIDRTFGAGLGFRPTGNDAMTLGVDGAVTQSGRGMVRAGARIGIPYVGYLRGEGVWETPTAAMPQGAFRAGVGLELVWHNVALGGGGFFGGAVGTPAMSSEHPVGGYGSARLEPTRDANAIPSAGIVVSIPIESDLGPRSLTRLVLLLERLRRDPSVRGVLFAPRGDVGGLANAEELREAFARLRASGRRVSCHLVEPTGSTYYACAGADEVQMDPIGTLRMAGIRTSRYFLGDALREVGIRTDFVRIGAWKSASEQFTRRGSTPEAIAQENQILDDLYATLIRGIADRGHVGLTRGRALIEGGPYGARQAREAGLIDRLGDRDMAERAAGRESGVGVVEADDYVRVRSRTWAPGRAIAVLHVDGDMVEGENFELPVVGIRLVGAETTVQLIDSLASNPRYAAIVVRIDSPGGSAPAAEVMWRALERASRRKPVIVSFGRIAASGGYYVAAPAREIFANPSTLTGSIGIFYGKADISELLSRLHVGVELYRRGPRADMDSIFRPFNEDERQRVGVLIRDFYNVFLQRVASGRHMNVGDVHAIAEGRVFTGVRARDLRLVDRLGGLAAALDRARELTGLPDDVEVVELPQEPGGLLGLIGQLFARDSIETPAARLLRGTEIGHTLSWLFTVAWAGHGRALAMTEWPLGLP